MFDTDDLPPDVLAHPLMEEAAWVALRDAGRVPLDVSDMLTTPEARAEFLTGAWLIDAIVPPGLGGSLLGNLQAQMLKVADVLNTACRRNGILEPRRSAKTTALWCVLLGRCYLRPVHMAGYSMLTTAKKTTERFRLDVIGPITRKWPDPKTRPVKLINSNGFERVEFPNGSVLAILSPEGDAIRSGAYDTLVLDEGGEPEADKWQTIVAAVFPAFDTRGPGAQLIVAGTGGRYRDGSQFWKALHDERAGRLRYGVADDVDERTLQTWETVQPIIERMHPGLDGLTNLDIIADNFDALGWELFAREYLGHFGLEAGVDRAVASASWRSSRLRGPVPTGVTPLSLAFALHPGGAWASIAVAWHVQGTPDDLVHAALTLDGEDIPPRFAFKIIHHQQGNARLEYRLRDLAREYRLPIAYDASPQEKAIVARLQRIARPRPQTRALTMAEKSVATTTLLNGIDQGTVDHWAQEPLDAAAQLAVFRAGKMRLLGVPDDTDPNQEITPLEAAAVALYALPSAENSAPARAFVVAD